MNLHNQSRNTMEKSEVRKIIVDIIAEIAPDEDLGNLKMMCVCAINWNWIPWIFWILLWN